MSEKFVTKVLAGWCVVGLIALAGCGGGEEPPRTLDLDGGSTEAAAPEASEESADEAVGEPREGELTRGASVASTPQEKEVAEAWFTYWEELVRVLGTPDASGAQLPFIARGQALHGPLAYAKELVDDDLRLGGGAIATLLKIDIAAGNAVVRGCVRTSMVKVDAADIPVVEMGEPWVKTKHTLHGDGFDWFVVEYEIEGAPKCV